MTTYPYQNNHYTLKELCEIKGANYGTVRPKFNKAGGDPVDVINELMAKIRFTWLSVARSIGINPHTLTDRINKFGLEKALLMGNKLLRKATYTPPKYNKSGVKEAAWDKPLPESDEYHMLKNLTKSLMTLRFEGEALEAEIIKRIS